MKKFIFEELRIPIHYLLFFIKKYKLKTLVYDKAMEIDDELYDFLQQFKAPDTNNVLLQYIENRGERSNIIVNEIAKDYGTDLCIFKPRNLEELTKHVYVGCIGYFFEDNQKNVINFIKNYGAYIDKTFPIFFLNFHNGFVLRLKLPNEMLKRINNECNFI